MDEVFSDFHRSYGTWSGPQLASTLEPVAPDSDPRRLERFYDASDEYQIQQDVRFRIQRPNLPNEENEAWVELFVAYWRAVGAILQAEEMVDQGRGAQADWTKVYETWKGVTNALIKGYQEGGFQAWTVPCLYVVGKYLRIYAMKADEQMNSKKGVNMYASQLQDDAVGELGQNEKLEDAARILQQIFQICINDRSPLEDSRKWALYYTMNLLFKTYFKLNKVHLSKNIRAGLETHSEDMPGMERFPKPHIVTFRYYIGVISFLQEDYAQAEENLTEAWRMCHRDSRKNQELILSYLIPTRLITSHTLPTQALLGSFPRLQKLFSPLCQAIKSADLAAFDAALVAGEDAFVKRRIYLTLERGRDIALRNVVRKVHLANGFQEDQNGQKVRKTRIPIPHVQVAISMSSGLKSGLLVERDEVECLLAGLIYKGLMKGYIARERETLVVSPKGNAFPGTGV